MTNVILTLALVHAFKQLPWQKKGIKIDGDYLNYLRFADDIVPYSNDTVELTEMLNKLQ